MNNRKGFTLVELIISITLVLLLFTLVVPGVTKLIGQSKIKQCEQIKENILTAVDLYVTEHKNTSIPSSIELSRLYSGNYIDEEYEIQVNNSTIKEGIWIKNGTPQEIQIQITKNETYTNSEYGYYTYNIETDFCN